MAMAIGQFRTVTGRGVTVLEDGGRVQIKLDHVDGGIERHESISLDADVAEAFETAIRVARRRSKL